MRCDVRVVGIRRVQCHLRAELAELIEQGIGEQLWHGRSRLQDLEASTIHSFSLPTSFLS
jgi:hypothetical protein